jgi:4-hydroxybenzoate polyprenyltransferase
MLYFFVNFMYTYWIKSVTIIEVAILSLFYSFRILAGGVASSVEVSKWLLAFSLFFFLSLAFGRRYQELFLLESGGRREPGKKFKHCSGCCRPTRFPRPPEQEPR